MLNRIFAVSIVAILAVSASHATIVTQENIVGKNGTSVNVVEVDGVNKVQVKSIAPAYGTSSTGKVTGTKVVNIPSITSLEAGQVIVVTPSVTNSATSNVKIQLNTFDAAPIKYKGANVGIGTQTETWTANRPSVFVYDGANWVFAGSGVVNESMSVNEGKEGIVAQPRSVTAANLKKIVQGTNDASSPVDGLAANAYLTGYTGPTTRADVASTDTIKDAIGKLEQKADYATTAAADAATAAETAVQPTDIATTNKVGVVKGGGNVAIANDGTMSVDLSGKQDKLDATANTGNIMGTNGVNVDTPTTGDNAGKVVISGPTLATVATSGSYNDLSNKPTIPAAQVNSDWNASSGKAQILNKPTLGTAAAKNVATGTGAAGVTDNGTDLVTADQVYEYVAANASASNFVEDSITDNVTAKAPSENAVYDALANKQGNLGGSGNDGKAVIATSTAGTVNYRAISSDAASSASGTSLMNEAGVVKTIQALDGALGTGNITSADGANVVTEVTQTDGVVTVTHGKAVNAVSTTTASGSRGHVVTGVTLNSNGKTVDVAMAQGAITDVDVSNNAAIQQSKIANLPTDLANAQNKIPSGAENSATLASIWVE